LAHQLLMLLKSNVYCTAFEIGWRPCCILREPAMPRASTLSRQLYKRWASGDVARIRRSVHSLPTWHRPTCLPTCRMTSYGLTPYGSCNWQLPYVTAARDA